MKYISVLFVFLALLLLLVSFAPSVHAEDAWNENLTWDLDIQTGVLTISGSGEMQVGTYGGPWDDQREEIKKIVIQEGVTGIGFRGFDRFYNLEEVVMPQSLKSIGDYAFASCYKLTGIDLTHVTSIGNYAFNSSGLLSVTIPEAITTIGRSTFADCRNLRELNLHDGITEIGYKAFSSCIALTSLRMPSSLETLYDFAFSYCTGLTDIQLNEGLQTIHRGAFTGCTSLETVIVPDSVQEIAHDAFLGCTNLRSIHFGASLSKIPQSAFSKCSKLDTFTMSENNPYMTVHQNGLYSLQSRELVAIAPAYAGSHVIPEGTVSIAYMACDGAKLTSITIPGTVSTVGDYAFADCADLKTVILNEGVECIGFRSFYRSGITEITFPATIKEIKNCAFDWCHDLEKITFEGLPPKVTDHISDVSITVYYPGYMKEWEDAAIRDHSFIFIPDCRGRHNLRWEDIKAPTCTEPGWHSERWCIVCHQDVEEAGEIPAIGHAYGAWVEVRPPTVEKEGLTKRTCSTCGAAEQKVLDRLQPPSLPPQTQPSQPSPTQPPTEAPSESPSEAPSEPTVSEPSAQPSTQPTVTAPPVQTDPNLPQEPAPATWVSVVTIAILSVLIGLGVSLVIFAFKKRKTK